LVKPSPTQTQLYWLLTAHDITTKVKLAALFAESEVRRKKFYSQISKKQVVFFTAMKGIQYYIITEDVGYKTNHCNAKQLSKLKKSAQSILVQKQDKREFSNNFQTTFRNTYVHIFYVTVFEISFRFHTCQNFELHYSESRDFQQNVRYGFTHRSRLRQKNLG